MKILVFEYVTGGGLARESIPQSLAREGALMLHALLKDLAERDDVRLSVMRDVRFETPRAEGSENPINVIPVGPNDEFELVWHSVVRAVDAVWPIAPETGGVLERLSRDVRAAGRILLNSPAEAIARTASKLQTLSHLRRAGIEVVPTFPLIEFRDQCSGPWVVKPDDGAGCEGMRIIRNSGDLKSLQENHPETDFIIQPWLSGTPMSLSALFKRGNASLLSCNQQKIAIRGESCFLTGCIVNVLPTDPHIYPSLVGAIARSIPDLFGYAGVDLIQVDGRPKVLEINPRLTTSYAVLSSALNRNVAARVLGLLSSDSPLNPENRYSGSSVDFDLGE